MKLSSVVLERLALGLCVLIVAAVLAPLLGFPYSPEDWTNLTLVGERSFWDCLRPFDPTQAGAGAYPYYRPLWYAWMKLASLLGLSGGAAHSLVIVAHLGAVILVYCLVRKLCGSAIRALVLAFVVGLAPGTQGALCWLPAGNKAFVLFFLLLGSYFILTLKRPRQIYLFFPLLALPALGSSENSYMMLLLFPLAACLRKSFRQESQARRWVVPMAVMALSLLFCLWHLSLLPQNDAAGASRVRELLRVLQADFFGWAGRVAQNLGRYFVHGIGLGEDNPKIGIVALIAVAVVGACLARREAGKRSYAVLGSLAFFLILNWPASFFGYESNRHHAYLPAIGAGAVLANLLFLLPQKWLAYALMLIVAFFVLEDSRRQKEWSRYLHHSQRVFESSKTALPSMPEKGQVIMLNVPFEYRAAFRLRLGPAARSEKWPDILLLTSKTSYVPPKDVLLPAESGCTLLEYDGRIIKSTDLAHITSKKKLPPAWFTDELLAFPDRVLRWGDILSADKDLNQIAWSTEPDTPQAATPSAAIRSLEVHEHGVAKDDKGRPIYFWELSAATNRPSWLVLAWSPVFMPSTERASPLFYLKRLPWLFETKITDLAEPKNERDMPVRPVLGILPAILLPRGAQRIRVELALRSR